MHLFFWKNSKKDKPVLIKKSCYDKLPKKHQSQFIEHNILEDDSSHYVMDRGGSFELWNTTSISGPIILDALTSDQQNQSVPEGPFPDPDFVGFGGGSTGDAGAGGNYGEDSNNQQQMDTSQSDTNQIPDQSNYSDDSASSDSSSFYDSSNSSSMDSGSSSMDSGSSSMGGSDGN